MKQLGPLLFFVSLLLWQGCTFWKDSGFKRRSLENYFMPGGSVRYFLSELPDWINFSETGKCYRKTRGKFIKMNDFKHSFNLTYKESIQFQYDYNIKYQEWIKRSKRKRLSLEEEEKLFYQISENIQGGIKIFNPPAYKRVHLIWIDPILQNKAIKKRLKDLMEKR